MGEIKFIPDANRVPKDPIAARKAENARAMQERAKMAAPELVKQREESERMLGAARARAQEEFGIDEDQVGPESKSYESERLQDRAAKSLGYKSGAAMVKEGRNDQKTIVQNAVAWFEKTFGVHFGSKQDKENKASKKAS